MSRWSWVEHLGSSAAHVLAVDGSEAPALPTEHHVLCHAEVGCQVDLLVNGADSERLGVRRAANRDRLSSQQDLAGDRPMHTGQRLDQRRLAGAVLAEQSMDLARQQPHRHSVEHPCTGECHRDPAQFDCGQARLGDRTSLARVGQHRVIPARSPRRGPASVTPGPGQHLRSVLPIGQRCYGLFLSERGFLGHDSCRHRLAAEDLPGELHQLWPEQR